MDSEKVFLSLGSNIGDKEQNLKEANRRISADSRIRIVKVGTPLVTAALEVVDQPDFLNQIILINTDLDPHELLNVLLEIENAMGRVRTRDKGPRLIDIDILAYKSIKMHEKGLHLPHHSLYTRPFIIDLLSELQESDLVSKFSN
ncbi:2-amino-4-hydroxy-6-hydroxymethyldihydropteridine diphosphokinase [Leptospira perolatii]|uniref:2-amino-4-hydroxy-6-hydroxymethyldihydropteridine pyrophosphokinase n=1 Tax=Leptospira perolatii TaxID=2023191 RepID=A0A2M9ZID9_9LEPT|nr:2-amino-4-hydroxy-6-hydroxymethyldihydropteridine diphosphokinase [Leptospira perolatii]PJZ68104.1 2-amino-4-hydroxy-6-hydroxymethyldihydropteridine diphosphokinase [Leptospira perolatii]PJZ71723.1 2-amino-4-hydroxy-6-hydroxymethyldihydropteridine diphosphokinase [Leptospira perolatii]